MMSLMLPGVAITYNGEEIGMTNTDVSWEDTVDPAGINCGEEHFMVGIKTNFKLYPNPWIQDMGCSRDPERTPMQWDKSKNSGFTNNSDPWLPVNLNYLTGINVMEQSQANFQKPIIQSNIKMILLGRY